MGKLNLPRRRDEGPSIEFCRSSLKRVFQAELDQPINLGATEVDFICPKLALPMASPGFANWGWLKESNCPGPVTSPRAPGSGRLGSPTRRSLQPEPAAELQGFGH
jgi:hypothetical protein